MAERQRRYMNPAYGRHIEGAREEGREAERGERKPHIHIHPHHDEDGRHTGTTVHVMHHDGEHEQHEHDASDAEGVAEHVRRHFAEGSPMDETMDEHANEADEGQDQNAEAGL